MMLLPQRKFNLPYRCPDIILRMQKQKSVKRLPLIRMIRDILPLTAIVMYAWLVRQLFPLPTDYGFTNGLKWKITETSPGAYKLTPRTGTANDRVLAAGGYAVHSRLENTDNTIRRSFAMKKIFCISVILLLICVTGCHKEQEHIKRRSGMLLIRKVWISKRAVYNGNPAEISDSLRIQMQRGKNSSY